VIFDLKPYEWHRDAACRALGHDLFYGPEFERAADKKAREKKAKALCAACPVRVPCLESAIERGDKYGIQGGLDEDERHAERRRRMRRVNAA